jgi:hypothetical protein
MVTRQGETISPEVSQPLRLLRKNGLGYGSLRHHG